MLKFADIRTNNLNLDINLNKTFTERVDLDETGIDSTIESTELGDQTDVTLRDGFVGVRTANAAGESSKSSNARAQGVDCARYQFRVFARDRVRATYSCFRTSHGCLGRFLQRVFAHS